MLWRIPVRGPILTNSYLYADEATRHGFLIDPGFEPARLLRKIREQRVTVEKILLTHAHFDHISAAAAVSEALGVKICLRGAGRRYAEDPAWNLSSLMGGHAVTLPAAQLEYLPDADGTRIVLAARPDFFLTLLMTPGHTADGTTFVSADRMLAFVGDSVFQGSYGRCDMPGGDERTLLRSIRKSILTLPPEAVLLPGHGEATTVAEERTRPWYQRA